MRTGFTSTSFRQIRDIEKIARTARLAKADCIEWGGDVHVKKVKDALNAKKLCDAYGIGISSYGSYYRVGSENSAEWEKICEIAAALGCSSVRVWLGDKNSEKTFEKEYEKLVEDASCICSNARSYGLNVCPECHDNTFNNDTDAFLKIREDIGADNFRTYFQSRYKRLEYELDRIERTLLLSKAFIFLFRSSCVNSFLKGIKPMRTDFLKNLLSRVLTAICLSNIRFFSVWREYRPV